MPPTHAPGSDDPARHEENERAIPSCAYARRGRRHPHRVTRGIEAVRDPGDPAQSAAQSGLLAPIIARSPWYLQIPLDAFAHFLASDGWAIASYIAFAVLAAMFPFLILVNALASAVGSSDLWAVGSHGLDPTSDPPLTEHWDGTAWTVVAGPSEGQLLGVAVEPSGTGISATGNRQASTYLGTLAEHLCPV